MVGMVLFATTSVATANQAEKSNPQALKMGFSDVFDRKFYEKKYFGIAITGASIALAGAYSYFTAGAGAPSAAAGVSTVASWVGGGGAGSYMAGLSTIGGVFGGNAMVGAAILNGISLGTIGGGAAFSTLPRYGQAMVLTNVSATMLDGYSAFSDPKTKSLEYRVALAIPKSIGSKGMQAFVTELRDLVAEERDLGKKLDQLAEKHVTESGSSKSSESMKEAEGKLLAARESRKILEGKVIALAERAAKVGDTGEDLVLLAVLSKNLGRSDLFAQLIRKVSTKSVKDAGYVDYLNAVSKIEEKKLEDATELLKQSWTRNPYAIEPPILLVNILGQKNFVGNEEKILETMARTEKRFDGDKYITPFSLVSMHYRIGTLALQHKKFSQAEAQFNRAHDRRSVWKKHIASDDFDNMIDIGRANAVYGQGRKAEATDLMEKILKRTKDARSRESICAQYIGECA